MGREPKLVVATGRKGVGKTFTTVKYIRNYVVPNPSSGWPSRRVLIFDTNGEFNDPVKYPDIRALALKDVAKYSAHPKIEIRRVAPFFKTGEEMPPATKIQVVLYILQNYRNGLLLLEDINNYLSDNMPRDVVGTILSQRHKGLDVMLHYQSIGRIQAKIWPHINILRMHKTQDSVMRHEEKFPDKYEILQISENIVNAKYTEGDRHFYLHVDFDSEKINGDFTKEEFEKAVEEYISLHYNRLVAPIMNRRDRSGNRVTSPEVVYDGIKEKLTKQYLPL